MKESLKAIRLIHNFLVGVCAAIVAFAMFPNPSAKYRASLVQLGALRQLLYEEYALFAHEKTLDMDRQDTTQCEDSIAQIGKIPISPKFVVHNAIFVVWPEDNATVDQLLHFFDNSNQVLYYETVCEWLTGPMTETLENYWRDFSTSALRRGYYLSSIRLTDPNDVFRANPRYPTFLLSERPVLGKIQLQLVVDFDSREENFPGGRITIRDLFSSYQVGALMIDSPEWIQSRPGSYRELVSVAGGQPMMFKYLKDPSNQIGFMKPGQAASYLQEKLDSTRPGISFLALSVEERLAVWAGALITLALLLFFFVHLLHLNGALLPNHDLLSSFPWIGLFNDTLSRILTHLSVIILPLYPDASVLFRSGHFLEWTTLLGCIFGGGTLVCSILAIREVNRLRHAAKCKRAHHTSN